MAARRDSEALRIEPAASRHPVIRFGILRRTAHTCAKFVAAALLLLLVIFAIVETGARLILDPRFGKEPYNIRHERAGRILKPNAVGEYFIKLPSGEVRRTSITISSQGLRNKELGPKRNGEFRILMLGDSFTMGTGLADHETIPIRLEQFLGEQLPDRDITVINGGVGGYGVWQEKILLEERGWPLQPDLVLLQVLMANDVANELRKDEFLLEAYNELDEFFWQLDLAERNLPVNVERWMWRNCRLYQEWVLHRGPRSTIIYGLAQLPFVKAVDFYLPPNSYREHQLESLLVEWYPLLDHGWHSMAKNVIAIRDECKTRGVRFAAFAMPSAHYVDPKAFYYMTMKSGVTAETYDREKDVALPEAMFATKGIPFIPLGAEMRAAGADSSWYALPDPHLTPTGAIRVADMIARHLQELGVLNPRPILAE